MISLAYARKIRKLMESGAQSLSDQDVSTAPEVLPRLKSDGALIPSGTRINWNGTVKRAAADLWDTAGNTPDTAPNLWEDIGYREGCRVIPDTITSGTAFAKGEFGWWDNKLYESLLDHNVWTPAAYPASWKLISPK